MKQKIWNGMNKHKPLTEEEMRALAKKVVHDICLEAAEDKKVQEAAWRKG